MTIVEKARYAVTILKNAMDLYDEATSEHAEGRYMFELLHTSPELGRGVGPNGSDITEDDLRNNVGQTERKRRIRGKVFETLASVDSLDEARAAYFEVVLALTSYLDAKDAYRRVVKGWDVDAITYKEKKLSEYKGVTGKADALSWLSKEIEKGEKLLAEVMEKHTIPEMSKIRVPHMAV